MVGEIKETAGLDPGSPPLKTVGTFSLSSVHAGYCSQYRAQK